MTYIDAAATRCARKRRSVVAIIGILGFGLTGCGTNNDVLGPGGLAANQSTPAVPSPVAAKQPARATIVIAPIIGAPDKISKLMTAQLAKAIEGQRVAISQSKDESFDYTLRGYVVAARETGGTKISYIWDVTEPAGRRVNRITGEQIIRGASGSDPWAALSPAIVQTIADKTARSFGSWLPNKPSRQALANSKAPASPVAVGGPVAAAGPAAVKATKAVAKAGTLKPQLAALKPANSKLASAGKAGEVRAIVPSVTGAPGDGSVALTSALQRELSRNGISLTNKRSATSYMVIGKVSLGKSGKGKQRIQIDWHVKDPKGKSLGTVSQKNKIPKGSLDGAWGKTADAAAAAAAQGILKLLPKPIAAN